MPTATTEAAPTPSVESTPAPSVPSNQQTESYSEAFSAIDRIPSERNESEPSPTPESKPVQEPKPASYPKAKETEPKPAERTDKKSLGDDLDDIAKPKEPKKTEKTDSKPVDDKEWDSPETPRKLRDAYKAQKDETAKERTTRIALEEKLKTAERTLREAVAKEYEPKIAAAEKRRDEIESELRFHNYSKSEEYKQKYEGPLKSAWQNAIGELDGMKIETADGVEREVQPQDIYALMRMPNPQAREAAYKMFGTAGDTVMRHRAELMRLTTSRDNAIDEWKTKGSEIEAQRQTEHQKMVEGWENDLRSIRSERSDLFGNRDGDEEGNGLLDKGEKLVQLAILGRGVPEGVTPEQRRSMILDAQQKVALRSIAYARTLRDLNKAQTEIDALKEKLAEYEGSEPQPGNRRGSDEGSKSAEDDSPEAAIDRLNGIRY